MTKAAELAKMGEVLTNSQIGGRRNMVINGAMNVAQRGTSETGMGATDGYFTVDRFAMAFSGTKIPEKDSLKAEKQDLAGKIFYVSGLVLCIAAGIAINSYIFFAFW